MTLMTLAVHRPRAQYNQPTNQSSVVLRSLTYEIYHLKIGLCFYDAIVFKV